MKRIFLLVAAGLLPGATCTGQNGGGPEPYRVGDYEVYVLDENQGRGDTSILIDAPQAVLERYAPDGTFPNALNAVLIKGKGKVWLVDTGFGQNIPAKMAELGVKPEDVDYVMITHMHGDHIGGMLSANGGRTFPDAEVILSRREHDYWASDEEMAKVHERARGNFLSAQKVFDAYAGSLIIIDPKNIGEERGFDDGPAAIAAYGHTPGHTIFAVGDGRRELIIWGDLTHAMAVQMPHPEISVTYDSDPAMARASRLEVLRHLAERGIAVVGMHVPAAYPGTVSAGEEPGSYVFKESAEER